MPNTTAAQIAEWDTLVHVVTDNCGTVAALDPEGHVLGTLFDEGVDVDLVEEIIDMVETALATPDLVDSDAEVITQWETLVRVATDGTGRIAATANDDQTVVESAGIVPAAAVDGAIVELIEEALAV